MHHLPVTVRANIRICTVRDVNLGPSLKKPKHISRNLLLEHTLAVRNLVLSYGSVICDRRTSVAPVTLLISRTD